jgi:peptide/nickel transport system permease protein
MLTFIVRRLLGLVAVMLVLSVLVFLIFFETPGVDPARLMAGRNPNPTTIANIRHEFGLDRSLPVRYGLMMKRMFITRDLISYGSHTKVIPEIFGAAPVTFSLVFGAAVIWVVFSILFGLAAAVLRGTIWDPLLMILALIGISMPVFWLGAILAYYLGFKANIFPNGGYTPLTKNPIQWIYHLILPWITLSVLFIGVYSRLLRSNVLDTINDDFVRTARAKGLSERRVLIRHVLRNSLIPVITLWGLDFGAIIGGGAILTESVFNLGGVGQYAADAIQSLDVPPVMAVTIFTAFFVVLFNTLVDIAYAWLDPRIRLS